MIKTENFIKMADNPNATMARICRLVAQEQGVDFLEYGEA